MSNFLTHPKESIDHHIRQHLGCLLNTRQQSITHLEDYGLPDVHQFLLELPQSTPRLCQIVRDLIVTYEPRLSAVTVAPVVPDDEKTLLQLNVSGQFQQHRTCQYMVHFRTDGFVVLA